ncbi:hypothetical protein niasHT_020069 [Heterodera trifolii]|uniref:Uncharacterized protein n=1 Tax=Heterodera trifolii TaxID=157864 RepID=A0ABD2LJK6_9BILA
MELIIEHTLDVAEDEKRNGKNKLKTIVEWFKNGTWTLEKEEDYDYGLAYSQDKQKTLKQFDKVGTSSAHGTDVEEEEEEVIEQLEDKKEKQNEKSQLND